MKPDFSFDARVSCRYAAQRAHPPEVSKAIGEAVRAQVGADRRVLEIGIGTGRIALPVVEAGCRVIGFDLSADMLHEVRAQLADDGRRARLRIVRADMHAIPLRDNSMDGAMAIHVLHLAQDWRRVLREAARVMRPGAAFIEGNDWIDPQSVTGALRDELRAKVAALSPDFMPPAAFAARDAFLHELGGADFQEFVVAEWITYASPAERLSAIAERRDSESWVLPADLFEVVLEHLRGYAAARWGDLETPQPVTRRFLMKVWRGEWRAA
jgi:SAM-dependent methyltransferase